MYLVSVLLIVVGTALAGLGVSVVCHDIAPGIAIMLMGLAALAGGIGMLCWYLKNRTELEAPGRVESATEWTAQTSAKTKKVCRVIGKWMLWTAGIILCINVTSRIVEAQKIKEEYVQVMGTVIDVDITSELKYSNAAEGYVESSSYGVLVDYQPQGESYPKSIYEIHSDEFSEEIPYLLCIKRTLSVRHI